MTETDALAWVTDRFPAAVPMLARMLELVAEENGRQNLVSAASLADGWNRHIADSLQLVTLASGRTGTWADIGTGGGFPGLAVATAWVGPVVLIEPRARRADFLRRAAATLGLENVIVHAAKAETVHIRADLVSARAVAPVHVLVEVGRSVASETARWLLPRGTIGDDEQVALKKRGMVFHVEQSVTSDTSRILVIDRVCRR